MAQITDFEIEQGTVTLICARFRHASTSDIEHLAYNRSAMVLYLAKAHDLTTTEAAEMLDDCLALRAQPMVKAA